MSKINWDKFKQGLAMALDTVNIENINCKCCPYYGLDLCDDDTHPNDAPCNISKEEIDKVVDYCKNKLGGA